MDMNKALADFFVAVSEGDKVLAAEILENIRHWLDKGWWLPDLRKAHQKLLEILGD